MQSILLIEDHAPMRRTLATALEMEGFEVLTAENGRIGIDLAQSELPDLIICDVMMPEVDGYEAMRQIRSQDLRLPVIALTATATPKVQSDIVKNLGLREPNIFISSFNRPNLYYEVQPKVKKGHHVMRILPA